MKINTLLVLLSTLFAAASVRAEELLFPVIEGPWIQIAGNPDLGEFTNPRQQPVDFAIWQAADGTWQAWSCIRGTKCGGHTRLFYRWESDQLFKADWRPMGIAMQADASLGEDEGGLQAPHVIKEGNRYHMFYGDWNSICHAVSRDGKTFERVIQPHGGTAMFTEGRGVNTRDVMMLKVGDLWHAYYCAYPNRQGMVFVRTTRDFNEWSESVVVAFGGIAGTSPFNAECPHVIHRFGRYYLFRTQSYGHDLTNVYHSTTPLMFGINQDSRHLATRLGVAAPEIVQHDGQDYIVALNRGLDGLRIARLRWAPPPKLGTPLLALADEQHRSKWKVETGNLPSLFTQSSRDQFDAPLEYFVGTAETQTDTFDDSRVGTIRSPEFEITDSQYFIYISGGADASSLYVALVDAETEQEIARASSPFDTNTLQQTLFQTDTGVGRRVFIRIVDESEGGWGHINFGGIFRAQ